ncbi:ferritin-like domain-containing protein [Chelativorans alearense]|uniref:ferritin-like domain-containing protein n=1 Tax=Chelativorans alearense TaxID=2681495 RepID=UPI001FEC45A5|nr:ferritin-like domain-containing protein [Chelativorans alearense]
MATNAVTYTTPGGTIENYPQLKARIEQHVGETRSQKVRLEACLKARGTASSGTKDVAGKATAFMQGLGGVFAGDEVVKGALASYAFEHMEIASYKILAAAARQLGDQDTAQTCDEICREEEEMAEWLADHIDSVVIAYLQRESSGSSASKR